MDLEAVLITGDFDKSIFSNEHPIQALQHTIQALQVDIKPS